MSTKYSEDREDIENVEAWAEVIQQLLYCVPDRAAGCGARARPVRLCPRR